jgi:hypothetical protein
MGLANWWAFKKAMWHWWWTMPFIGAPHWGRGSQRRKNLDIATARHDAQKPDCENFGLQHQYVETEEHCRRCYQRKSA